MNESFEYDSELNNGLSLSLFSCSGICFCSSLLVSLLDSLVEPPRRNDRLLTLVPSLPATDASLHSQKTLRPREMCQTLASLRLNAITMCFRLLFSAGAGRSDTDRLTSAALWQLVVALPRNPFSSLHLLYCSGQQDTNERGEEIETKAQCSQFSLHH